MLIFASMTFLCAAVPVAAGRCPDSAKPRPQRCHVNARPPAAAAPAKQSWVAKTVILKSTGGGGYNRWSPLASDLMP
jgi:hypothetical protein